MKKYLLFLMVALVGCGKGDDGPPPAPEGAVLTFPLQNSECTTGIDLGNNLSQVTFQWEASKNTNLYTLTVINLNTNIPLAVATASTSVALAIEKGAPFLWNVLSSNNDSDATATSGNNLFYNAGALTSFPPFPAQIITPKSGSTVQMGQTGEVVLSWSGTDIENDIESYEVYFSDENPPSDILVTLNNTTEQTSVVVANGTTYYWRVITIDAKGNSSDTGIYDFKVY
ncbi:MAG: fibronectin type III domain-containing protein [Croceitalea sp.]|nr:fibronectin type III domain-containing protein [Croceitalea sp.]MBT8238604.1 fibronectin type III domain-containing protein [Croceitalea sp.]NNC35486.1 fibronectin type III domain-containing protein [Croceitalea sp.]NNL08839.1 fibronectin type III domain-containing protein [Croceitalea sp.]NNM17838.1 fibronectin type III domain-containing protein [Croceitalea sp.]